MNSEKQNALIAKSRAIYGKRISEKEYELLMQKHSVSQVVAHLKKSARYGGIMNDLNEFQAHRGQIELVLERTVFDIYLRLFRFAVEDMSGFGGFLIRKKEIEIILNTVMYINSGEFDRIVVYLPLYLSDYLSFDLMKLAGVKSFDALIKALEGSKYQTLLQQALPNSAYRSGELLNLEEFVQTLYTEYFRNMLKLIDSHYKGNLRNKLREILFREITMINYSAAYRMKTLFKRSNDEILHLLMPLGKSDAPKDELFLDTGKMLALLNTDSGGNIETAMRASSYGYYKKELKSSSYGIVVIYALIQLLEAERLNITAILEGVRYSLSADEIEKLIVK